MKKTLLIAVVVCLLSALSFGQRSSAACKSGEPSTAKCFAVYDSAGALIADFTSLNGLTIYEGGVNPQGQWSIVNNPTTATLSQTVTSGNCGIGMVLISAVPHVAVQCYPSGGSLGSLILLDTSSLTGFTWTSPLTITIAGGAVSATSAAQFQPQRGLTITGIQFSTVSAVLSCSVYPQLQVYDTTGGAPLNSGFVVGPGFTDDGVQSISVTSGHLIGLRIDPSHLGSGCGNGTFTTQVNLIYN